MIVIRKYPNRRLYNTDNSHYIKLDDIKLMINEHTEFMVVDSKTKDDITRQILLQIISDQESNENKSLLTNNVLKTLIRFQETQDRGYVAQYIEQGLAALLEHRRGMKGMVKTLIDVSPIGFWSKIIDRSKQGSSNNGSTDQGQGSKKD